MQESTGDTEIIASLVSDLLRDGLGEATDSREHVVGFDRSEHLWRGVALPRQPTGLEIVVGERTANERRVVVTIAARNSSSANG